MKKFAGRVVGRIVWITALLAVTVLIRVGGVELFRVLKPYGGAGHVVALVLLFAVIFFVWMPLRYWYSGATNKNRRER